jgi:hypothetical protein
MDHEPKGPPTSYNLSSHRLPDWAFGIALWLFCIGAPFSLVVGLAWGLLSTLPSPLAPYRTPTTSEQISDWLKVLRCGIIGLVVGTTILASIAITGCGVFLCVRHALKLTWAAVRLLFKQAALRRPASD